jgi:hypothetical protein
MSRAQHADTRRERYAPQLHEGKRAIPYQDTWSDVDGKFHDTCGFLWSLHSNRVAGRALPFGCPSELEVRSLCGDR